ncbi:MAG: 3-phosphoshikimate 1-carboxyvinyltransferase [Lachnospiraceae bacterium]|nr:3-phosphoshikimate 1-carboxyvinyltransferase [Lachnospiraceae bacterium]
MENLRVASVPGSKSITNRALLLAALSDREYLLRGAQFSDDSRYFLDALKALGFSVREDETAKTVCITGMSGRVPEKNAGIYVGSAGTAARFLTAMLACSDGIYTIRASEQMAARPMKPLFDALATLGAEFTYLGENGHLPVTVRGIFCESVAGADGAGARSDGVPGCDVPSVFTGAGRTGACPDGVPGCDVPSTFAEAGCAGAYFEGSGGKTPEVSLDIRESTQYLSALLMTASMLPDGLAIHITSEKKRGSYIEITRRMMEEFGIRTEFDGESYRVKNTSSQMTGKLHAIENDEEQRVTYQIEPDVSAACYFYAAAMLTGGSVQVRHVHRDTMQGDRKFLGLLEQMGAAAEDLPGGICVTAPASGESRGSNEKTAAFDGNTTDSDEETADFGGKTADSDEETAAFDGKTTDSDEKTAAFDRNTTDSAGITFPGLTVNMNDFSDQAITLAALAPFASSPTEISGIAHIRRQESDRLHGIAENLSRMGIRTEESEDSVKIWPGDPGPCEIETYDDHRMAMGFALVGLRVPGMKIRHPECCQKTFKEYFDEMEKVFGLKFAD